MGNKDHLFIIIINIIFNLPLSLTDTYTQTLTHQIYLAGTWDIFRLNSNAESMHMFDLFINSMKR